MTQALLPRLLRQLQQAAHDRDTHRGKALLAELGRNHGWKRDVDDFIKHMPSRERHFAEGLQKHYDDSVYGGGSQAASGSQATPAPASPMAGVTRDATSGIYCPANAAEWSTVMAAAGISSGGPSLLYLLQEASSNVADSIGAFTGTVTAASYQQPVTGWSRKAITGIDGGAGLIDNLSASLPDPSTTSMLMLSYAIVSAAPAAIRNVQSLATTNLATSRVNTTPCAQGVSGASVVTGTSNPTGAVRPWVLEYDKTNSAVTVYTDQEKLSPTFTAASGQRHRLHLDFAGGFLYHVAFFGPAAELTDAQVKTLLQTLGWAIPWS